MKKQKIVINEKLRVQRIILYGSMFLIFLGCSNAHATRSQSSIYMRKHFSCTDSLPTSELLQAIKSFVDSSCPKRLDNKVGYKFHERLNAVTCLCNS